MNHACPTLQDIPHCNDPAPVEVFTQLGVPSSLAGLRIRVKNRLVFTPRAIYQVQGQYYELNTMYRMAIGKQQRQHLFIGGGLGFGWQGRQFGMTYLVDQNIEPYYYTQKSRRGYFQTNYIYTLEKFRLQAAAQLARYIHTRFNTSDVFKDFCQAKGNELPSGWLYSFTLASEFDLGNQNTLSFIATGNLHFYDQCIHSDHSLFQLGVQMSHRFRRLK